MPAPCGWKPCDHFLHVSSTYPLQIVDCADRVMVTIVETYFVPNRSVREIHELVKSRGALIDPLRQFSELARNDIAELRPH